MKYSIDTSSILDAWTRYYPPDVMPGLWKQLEELIDNGQLILLCQINHPFRRLMLVLFSTRFEVMPPSAVDLSVM